METLITDLRYAVRRLAQRPGFAVIAMLTIALGVGANSAIFSIVNAILLRPLPVESPDRLVEIYSQEGDEEPVTQAYPDYLDIRARDDLFSGVTAYTVDFFSVDMGQEPEVMLGESVSGNYFEVLGVPAALGRALIPGEDDAPGAPAVAVISHAFWNRRFASDSTVLGQMLRVKGRPVEIIGVMPPKFKGLLVGFSSELWLPLTANVSFSADDLDDRQSRWLLMKGRLRPGVTPDQAQAGLDVLAGQLAAAYPESNADRRFPVIPTNDVRLHPMIDRALVPVAALLMTVVGLLLLIVCTNLANLLLARALARRKEIAIRLAIGAGRGRLVRQLLTESVLLALLGGVLGLAVAWGTVELLVRFQPPILFRLSLDLGIDGRVLPAAANAGAQERDGGRDAKAPHLRPARIAGRRPGRRLAGAADRGGLVRAQPDRGTADRPGLRARAGRHHHGRAHARRLRHRASEEPVRRAAPAGSGATRCGGGGARQPPAAWGIGQHERAVRRGRRDIGG
jgi:predicted permease